MTSNARSLPSFLLIVTCTVAELNTDGQCSLDALRPYFVGPPLKEAHVNDGCYEIDLQHVEDVSTIVDRVLRSKSPVLLRNVKRIWPDVTQATMDWQPENLVTSYGHRLVNVQVSASEAGVFDCNRREEPCAEAVEEMSIADFFSGRPAAMGPRAAAYWQNNEISETGVEELAMQHPPFTGAKTVSHRQWVSRSNVSAAFHFDYDPNFVLVKQGAKTFFAYDMFQAELLYPGLATHDKFHTAVQFGAVDPTAPASRTRQRYPLFAEAKGIHCTARAGDLLHIPAYWWHFVSSTVEDGFSVGINWFVEAPEENRLPDACYEDLPLSIADHVLASHEARGGSESLDAAARRFRQRLGARFAGHDRGLPDDEDFYEEEGPDERDEL